MFGIPSSVMDGREEQLSLARFGNTCVVESLDLMSCIPDNEMLVKRHEGISWRVEAFSCWSVYLVLGVRRAGYVVRERRRSGFA